MPKKAGFLRRFFLCLFALNLWGCQQIEYYPKPRGYHRIDLPAHAYQPLAEQHPYTFEYSQHAVILPDSSTLAQPHWIELNYLSFRASVSISYKRIVHFDSLAAYVNSSSRLTHKHNVRSSSITEYPIKTPKGYGGVVSELSGDVPSFYQFWVTDTTTHFLRAALYFPTSQRADSLAPVIAYVKEDLTHLLHTLAWRDEE